MAIFTSWQFAVLINLITAMIFNQTYKMATKSMLSAGALTVMLEGISGLFCFLLIPLFGLKMPTDPMVYICLLLACVFYALNDRLTTDVRKGLDVSLVNIIKQFSSVLMIAAGVIIFKEELVFTKLTGALLIIASNILVFYNRSSKLNKYVWIGLFATFFATIALMIDVNYSQQFNLPLYVGITLFVPSLIIAIFERIPLRKVKLEFDACNKSILILTTVSWAVMTLSRLLAYQVGEIIVVTPLCSLVVILNVFLGYFFFGERDNLIRKLIASVLIIFSVFLIQL